MRLLIAWIVLAGLAAASHWIGAPMAKEWAASAGTSEGLKIDFAAVVGGSFLGGFLDWMLPLALLFGGLSITWTWIAARARRK